MFFAIPVILLVLYSRMNKVAGACIALGKRQQSAQQPVVCSASTTCKCRGPIQHRSPQVKAPTNVPVPTGMFTQDCGNYLDLATQNANYVQFLDGLRNVIAEMGVDNGQTINFNYGTLRSGVAGIPKNGSAWACGSVDLYVAYAVLQGPGGSTDIRNPFYTTAGLQINGKLNWCGGCAPRLLQPGFSFQDRTPCYCFAPPVNKARGLMIQPASAIVSPGNAACTQHS